MGPDQLVCGLSVELGFQDPKTGVLEPQNETSSKRGPEIEAGDSVAEHKELDDLVESQDQKSERAESYRQDMRHARRESHQD